MAMKEAFIKQRTRQELVAHFDADETGFLERQLTYVRSRVFQVQYSELRARLFLPLANDIPSSAETYVYNVYDRVGRAKIGANDSDDPPRVDVVAREVTGKVRPVIASYGWGLNAMREAARIGTPLGDQKALAARQAIETSIDEMLAYGDLSLSTGQSNVGLGGFVNNADVVAMGITAFSHWVAGTSADTILGELNAFISAMINVNGMTWLPDTLLLPTPRFNLIAQKKVGTDNDKTILRSFLDNSPYIRNIDQWIRLNGAGASGKDRAILYKRDPAVLEGVVPQEFEQLPPQARNFEMVVPCSARCGGVKVYQPLAVHYGDFATS